VHDRGAARERLDPGDAGEAVEHVERFEERGPPHDPVPAAQVGAGFGDTGELDVLGELFAVDEPAVAQLRLGVLRELAAHEDRAGPDGFGAERLPEGAHDLAGHPALLPGEFDGIGAERGERLGKEGRPVLVARGLLEVGGRVDPVEAFALGLLEGREHDVSGPGVGRQAFEVVLRCGDPARARSGLPPSAFAHWSPARPRARTGRRHVQHYEARVQAVHRGTKRRAGAPPPGGPDAVGGIAVRWRARITLHV
jgi:hypothetical protein